MTKSLTARLLNRAPVDVAPRRFWPGTGVVADQNQESMLRSMTSVPTLFAIVDRLATGVAATEWKLYRKAPSGKREDRVEVTAHPALSVWSNPNPFYSQAEFVEAVQQHYDLTGEMWWLVGRSALLGGRGVPIELWPVRPDRMRPVPDPEQFVKGYIYRGTTDVPLATTDVLFTKRQSPLDPYRGISPVGSLLYDIAGEKEAAAYNAMFFRNGAMPGGVIETEGSLSDPEFDELVARWSEQHQGTSNAHRVAVLERAKFHELRYTNRDMEFVELRRFSKEQIRQAYGFPKPLLGDVDDVNRANAEAAEVVFSRWLLNPRLDRIRDTLNLKFLPLFGSMGEGYEFDYSDPTPESEEGERAERDSKVAAVAALVAAGYDPNDCLRAFGLPPLAFRGNAGFAPEG